MTMVHCSDAVVVCYLILLRQRHWMMRWQWQSGQSRHYISIGCMRDYVLERKWMYDLIYFFCVVWAQKKKWHEKYFSACYRPIAFPSFSTLNISTMKLYYDKLIWMIIAIIKEWMIMMMTSTIMSFQRWVSMDNWRIEILCTTCKWT